MSWWLAAAEVGAEALKDDDAGSAFPGQPAGPITQSGAGWTVNFGKKPLDLNALDPLVMIGGLVVAGAVAIVAVKAFTR